MKLYRSIGEKELRGLLEGQMIYGMFNCQKEHQNNSYLKNACCFFVDEVRWNDASHEFMLVLEIPEERLTFGIGDYYAGKSLKDEKIWSGRNGSLHYKIREAYTLSYCIDDVKEIYLFNHFADWYVEKLIKPICKSNNVKLYRRNEKPFTNSKQTFVKVPYSQYECNYVTNEFSKDWENLTACDNSINFKSTCTKELTNKEKQMIYKALNYYGDFLANKIGYSTGEEYWNLMQKFN